MTPERSLSGRAFKHLRRITNQVGISVPDEEIHDMAHRLIDLGEVLSKQNEAQEADFNLTKQEIAALEFIQEAENKETSISSRKLSHALGYASSRSGHMLVRRLQDKGFIITRQGRIELKRDVKIDG